LNPLKNEKHLTNDCQLNGQFFKIVAKWSEIETLNTKGFYQLAKWVQWLQQHRKSRPVIADT
jgi:hypothetical protein